MIQINYTEIADESIDEIMDFLFVKWTEDDVDFFFDDVDRLIETFNDGIIKYPFYKKTKIQQALIAKKQVTAFFIQQSEKEIDLILFWANKKDPRKLEKLLKSI